MKQWFPVECTNGNRASAGSAEGIAGRAYPILVAERMRKDRAFRMKICECVRHHESDFKDVVAGRPLSCKVASVVRGRKTSSKTTLRIIWKDNSQTNFIVKKSRAAHICLKKVESFIPEFEAQYKKRVPAAVRKALLLFVGRHPRQKEILDSISVNFVGDDIRDLERSYHNRLTLASMSGYNVAMADKLLNWLRANAAEITEFCFSRGAARDKSEFAEYLWYHTSNGTDSDIEIFNLNVFVHKLKKLPKSTVAAMTGVSDRAHVGSALNVPFGTMQYHEDGIEFRHDRNKINRILNFKSEKKKHFGATQKKRGHENEDLIVASLNGDREFRSHFCCRVGRAAEEFVSAEGGGKNAKQEVSVLGGKTPGKTDVSVLWNDGTHTNISVKMNAAGQVYLVTAKNFVAAYEAQYEVVVPSKVCRALAFFIGEDSESRSILDATNIEIDGRKARKLAYDQNCRLMFDVIKNYDPLMASELLLFLHDKLANVFELSFAAGAVRDRGLWSDVLWYKNLVDDNGLDYLVSIPIVKTAIQRKLKHLVVEPGKHPGSTIQFPFGHLQYHKKQLEFYQKLKKIQQLVTDA